MLSESGEVVVKRVNNPIMHLRKACNHPYQLVDWRGDEGHEDEEELVRASGKMVLLDNILAKLKKTGGDGGRGLRRKARGQAWAAEGPGKEEKGIFLE